MVSYHNRKIVYLIGGKRHDHHLKAFYGDLAFRLSVVNLQNIKCFYLVKQNGTNFLLISQFILEK